VNIFFSADWHNLHYNILRFCNRPFKNVIEQEQCLLENHNSIVKPKDIVYCIGDIAMTKEGAISALSKMNGIKIFILGNHDFKFENIIKQYCREVHNLCDIRIEQQKITLCHYAMRVWNCSHHGAWCVHGHSHGTLPSLGKSYDVGVDSNNFKPVSFEELEVIMSKKECHHLI
jgi:calcineurin-like phosphoesterase family protein